MHVQAEGSAVTVRYTTMQTCNFSFSRDCRALGAPDACVCVSTRVWVGKCGQEKEAGLTQPPS